jgi:adenosine deaminase/aminodeoxyfutalosine deaminase
MRPSYHDWAKAELHLHLEGSVDAATLLELAPGLSPEAAEAMYRFDGFAGFLQSFAAVVKSLTRPEDYGLVTRRLIEKLEAENVRYAEVIVSAGVVLWKGQEFGPVFDAIAGAAEESPVKVRWVLDAVRQFGAEHAMEVARLAAERTGRGVVGFGIGGDEERGPASWFHAVYEFAREAGLHLTAHAGESAGPESVWQALELGVERIGHGIRAVEDALLVEHLREERIPLEISITSNLVTGVTRSLEEHPVRRLFDAGVPITLNTDDPAMFGTTLSHEYEVAARHFGFSEAELREVSRNAFRYAFDPAARAAAI